MPRNGLIPTTDEKFPVRRGQDGFPLCRYCGKRLPTKQRRWCSRECVDAALQQTNPGWMRSLVRRRDRGVCALCGWDTEKWSNVASAIRLMEWRDDYPPPKDDLRFSFRELYCLFELTGYESRDIWEADHIVPLIEGGTNTLDNMRTLCVPCHKKETRELARRRAVARKKQKRLSKEVVELR